MDASGNLTCQAKDPSGAPTEYYNRTVAPNISVEGNSGFKFGIAIALQLGKTYHPVAGLDYAGKSSFTTNILYLRQQFGEDKTPDEIAKDKGYVRGAKKEEATEESAPAESPADSEPSEPAEDIE